MTTPTLTSPVADPVANAGRKKRVLLVDGSLAKRDLRAEAMRKLGMEVDCAADISEARSWWRPDLYNLVLISVEHELGHRDRFCEDVRAATPPQQLAFLVGKPGYVAEAPTAEAVTYVSPEGDPPSWGDVKAALSADLPEGVPQRWGILEASRRISAVRSLSHARSRAMRERPEPPRDSEVRPGKRLTESRTLDELLKEEMR